VTIPPEGNEWTDHQEVQLLERIEEGEQGEESTLRQLLERADIEIGLLTEIRDTLTEFLKDWKAANTEHPATKVILTWGSPQAIPKGP
jgi:hypothetical protein